MDMNETGQLAINALRIALKDAQMPIDERAAVIGHFCNQWNALTNPAPGQTTNPAPATNLLGWQIHSADDGQYLYIQREGSPGTIHIKAESEGVVADIWSDDESPVCMASAAATYTELERE